MTRFLTLLASLFLAFAVSGAAMAQQIKPLEIEPDENGVDMLSGRVAQHTLPSLSVPGAGSLQFSHLSDLMPFLTGQTNPGGQNTNIQVNAGGSTSESFDCFDDACESSKQIGSRVVGVYSSSLLYTQGGSGKRIVFDQEFVRFPGGGFGYYASSVTYPNGESHVYTYSSYVGPGAGEAITERRPTKIVSNLGYEMHFTYQSEAGSEPGWRIPATVAIYKSSAPTAALLSYSYSGNTITDITGRSWVCSGCDFAMTAEPQVSATSLQLPGEAATSYTTTALPNSGVIGSVVKDVTKDGTVWNYSYENLTNAYLDIFTPNFDKMTVTGPNGYTRTVDVLNPQGQSSRVTKITDALNRQTTFGYDTYGRMITVTQPEGNSVEVTYDLHGNITEKRTKAKPGSGLADIVETANYPSDQGAGGCLVGITCFRPNWTRDAKGNQTDYTWDTNHGGLLTSLAPADANGVRTKTINEYTVINGFARLTKTRSCSETASGTNLTCGTANEVVKEITYWESTFLPLTEKATNPAGSISAVTTYEYDAAGRVLSIDGPLPGTGDKSYIRYDILGRKTWEIAPLGAGGKHSAKRTTYRAADDQVVKVENGTLTSPTDTNLVVLDSVETEYNSRRLAVKTLVKGGDNVITSVSQASYDARNLPLCSTVRMNPVAFGSASADACVAGTAGAQGGDRIAKTIYDVLGRPVQMRRAVGTPLEQAEATYSYTLNGQKRYVVDANGNRAELVYDGFDRQIRWSFPSTTLPTAYNDATAATALASAGAVSSSDYEQYGYDANGNRTSLRKRDGLILTYNYDNVNRMVSKIVPAKPGVAAIHTRSVYYDYDFRGLQLKARFTSLTGPGVDNAYDVLGRMTSSTNRMFASPLTLTYRYDSAGRRIRVTHPGGQYFTYSYSNANEPRDIFENGTTRISEITYNAADNRMALNRRVAGLHNAYSYDPVGRVDSLSFIRPTVTDNAVFTFGYNAASQMVSRTTSNDAYANSAHYDVDRNYAINGLNQYIAAGPAAFTYDPNGNLTSDGAVTFTYDAENRLVQASGARNAELIYDPLGRLWEINAGTNASKQRLLYDGDALVAEYNDAGVMTNRYVHGTGADTPYAWYTGSTVSAATRRHLFANWQGSIALIANATGGTVAVNAYDAYGIPNTTNLGRFQYTGQIWIPELGMYYYKARIYSPTLGRFLQTDPIGYEDQYNLYAYTGNDPVNLRDPSGMSSCSGCDGDILLEGTRRDGIGKSERSDTQDNGVFGRANNSNSDSAGNGILSEVASTGSAAAEGVGDWFSMVGGDLAELAEGLSEGEFEWALGGAPPMLGGGVLSSARSLSAISVRFGLNANQFYHTWRWVVLRGHDPVLVDAAIRHTLASGATAKVGQKISGLVVVNGATIEFSAFRLSRSTITVTSIKPPK